MSSRLAPLTTTRGRHYSSMSTQATKQKEEPTTAEVGSARLLKIRRRRRRRRRRRLGEASVAARGGSKLVLEHVAAARRPRCTSRSIRDEEVTRSEIRGACEALLNVVFRRCAARSPRRSSASCRTARRTRASGGRDVAHEVDALYAA